MPADRGDRSVRGRRRADAPVAAGIPFPAAVHPVAGH
jgi:hypothetical protein